MRTREVAELLGIRPNSWRTLVSAGKAPKADDPDDDALPGERRPKWRRSTIDAFIAARPGQGRGPRGRSRLSAEALQRLPKELREL